MVSQQVFAKNMQINLSPMKKIWEASLETGKLPETTAQAFIPPIYKGDLCIFGCME